MVRNRLTDRKIKALRRKGFRYDVMDTDVPGFGVRIGEAGLKTFILIARYPGSENPTRRALGEYPALSLQKARERPESGGNYFGEELTQRLKRNVSGA